MPLELVLEEVRRIAATELELNVTPNLEHTLMGDLGLDSMALTILAVGLENRFRVKLEEKDGGEVNTVADLCTLVSLRRAQSEAELRP